MSFFEVFSAYYNNNSSISPSKKTPQKATSFWSLFKSPPAINRIFLPAKAQPPKRV